MRATRWFWSLMSAGGFLVFLAVVVDWPALLFGAAAIGAWLVARQYVFARMVGRTVSALEVSQMVTPERPLTDDPVELTVSARVANPETAAMALRIEAQPPMAVTGSTTAERTVTLAPDDESTSLTVSLTCPVAGQHQFDPVHVHLRDRVGLFRETVAVGPTPTLTVAPRTPRNVHVGHGGERIAVGFGEHKTGRFGAGIEPAELRKYTPGDPASRIAWKATARLNEPHVIEFEGETDRTTAVLVDHRPAMATGAAGQTKLDYAREVALAFVEIAQRWNDPLGFYTVGDEGLTVRFTPAATDRRYLTIRQELYDLAPTDGAPTPMATTDQELAAIRRAAARLDGADIPFARQLRPYFERSDRYVERLTTEPLFVTARTELARLRGPNWTILFTDDTDRTEVRETVKLLRRGDDHVLVCLTPDVLYTPGGLTDVEAAYDRYTEFESFRRDLDRLERVTALEVAPGDRLEAVLTAGRQRRTNGGGP